MLGRYCSITMIDVHLKLIQYCRYILIKKSFKKRNYGSLLYTGNGRNGEKSIFWEMSENVCWYTEYQVWVELRMTPRFLAKGPRKMELFIKWGKLQEEPIEEKVQGKN